jgi:hypothetical protein
MYVSLRIILLTYFWVSNQGGPMMPVHESGEGAVAKAIPYTGNDTDQWAAVAVVALLMTLTLAALVQLVLRAAGS